jgi:type II secretory pathway pseudopilin PulG
MKIMKENTLAATKQDGYTLIELLLYVVLIGMLLSSVTYFFGLSVDARVKSQSIAEVNDQGVAAMDYITQTIRNASSITSPTAAGTGASLTLAVPTGSLSPTVFDLSGSTLQVKEGASAAIALTSNDVQISNLTFKNLTRSGTNGVVQVSFTVSRTNPNNRNAYDYQKTFTGTAEVGW